MHTCDWPTPTRYIPRSWPPLTRHVAVVVRVGTCTQVRPDLRPGRRGVDDVGDGVDAHGLAAGDGRRPGLAKVVDGHTCGCLTRVPDLLGT